jgi:RHS repeat-associated protein
LDLRHHNTTPRYDFNYDLMGRLTSADFGGTNNALQTDHSRTYSYDRNGNMTLRQSKEQASQYGGASLNWTWNSGNGNRPATWHQQRNNLQNPSGPSQVADESYAYDATGNRTAVLDGQGDTLSVMRYNLLNLPEEYVLSGGAKERFVYSADGEKLFVQHITASSDTTGTEYAANYRFENDTLAMIHTDAGYYTPVPPPSGTGSLSFMHVWYLKDHLGNNRVLADGTGTALKIHHYDPFGEPITIAPTGGSPAPSPSFPAGATESPYKYGGKEWSEATLTYDFEARQFSPDFHRFTTMDPLCEKYYGISPYAYCANNPVNLVDYLGERPLKPAPKSVLGTAAYYQWRNADYQSRHPGKEHSYYLSYGYANATRFERIPNIFLSKEGVLWRNQVELGLQLLMEKELTSNNEAEAFEDNGEEFLDFAFKSHVIAYLNENGVNLKDLPTSDLIVIVSTPKLSHIMSPRGGKQVIEVMKILGKYWNDHPDTAYQRVKEGTLYFQQIMTMAILNSYYQYINNLSEELQYHDEAKNGK